MAQQTNAEVDEIISNAVQLFCPYYESEYPKSQQVKDGLKRLLRDRYRNCATNFVDKFIHPTLSLLGDLKDQEFPLCSNGKIILHLVPPSTKLEIGEFFYQVGHTYPRTLVVKFAKYERRGTSFIVNPLQRSRVNESDYDIAFTKEYFDDVRSEAPGLGDVVMRTLIVLSEPNWVVQREGAVDHYLKTCPVERRGRLRSDSHLSVEESCDDESSTSDRSMEPHSPTENYDDSSLRDDLFRRLNSSDP